ncbi:hypothetical protein N7449_000537 [Penicillium cf. viridicatum]|uniref:Uncharacterized protein n=1 Tax=Penicillium cf. viridicatum TaxID=2972119 RepID=A0A9W9N659_9EURO|nr:hypothetical protein N7449_000537 [Penicillium cf. viridicatum]
MQSVLELNMVESSKDLRPGNVAEVPHKMKQTLSKEQIGYGIYGYEISNNQANNYGNNASPVSEDNRSS